MNILAHLGEVGALSVAIWMGFMFMQNTNKDFPLYSKVFGWAIAVGGWLFVVWMLLEIIQKL